MLHALLRLYQDPMFWLLPIGSSLVSMGSFVLFAAPLSLIAWKEPAWSRRYKIQSRRPRAQELVGPSIAKWLTNNAIMLAVVIVAWPLLRLSRIHDGPLPPVWRIA